MIMTTTTTTKMMKMVQRQTFDENNRLLNYTVIDQCQDNVCNNTDDEYYRQISNLNEHVSYDNDRKFSIILQDRLHLILFIFLIFTSKSNALPVYQPMLIPVNSNQFGSIPSTQQTPLFLPIPMAGSINRLQHSPPLPPPLSSSPSSSTQLFYKVYRRLPNTVQQQQQQRNSIPSYSNGAIVNIYDQTNVNNQQQRHQELSMNHQTPNSQHLALQMKRERQRRTMIDKIISIFDEDGNGYLEKDELYSMALRSNMFPKFHYYLKHTTR